jgi:hypothetical protein
MNWKRRIIKLAVGALIFFGGYMAGTSFSSVVHAQSGKQTVPKTWGHCVGVNDRLELTFEASDGTVRTYNTGSRQLTMELTRN